MFGECYMLVPVSNILRVLFPNRLTSTLLSCHYQVNFRKLLCSQQFPTRISVRTSTATITLLIFPM